MLSWLLVLFGYVVGSFPTAYVFGRKLKRIDIRKVGDRNMGARNAWFEIGHLAGLLIYFIDLAKGFCPMLLARLANVPEPMLLMTGVATVLGHNFPLFLRFRGGRGEATTMGIILAILPLQAALAGAVAFLTLLAFKNVILSSAVFFVGLIPAGIATHASAGLVVYAIALAIFVGLTHFFRTWRRRPVGAA